MALYHLKFDNIFTTAVLFVAVSPSALSVLWKKKRRKGTKMLLTFNSQLWDSASLDLSRLSAFVSVAQASHK